MIYAVELVVYRTIPTFGKRTETYHFITFSAKLHESSIDEWQDHTTGDLEREYPNETFIYKINKRPVVLTMGEALDLYPRDFKLWCEDQGFTNLLKLLS